MASIPFEDDDEVDCGSNAFPFARVALAAGASLLAVWICPLFVALSAMTAGRRDPHTDPIPDTGPLHHSTAFPSVRAA